MRSPPDRSGPRLVVLRALGLGDFLTGIPALRALRDANPGHRLVLAGPSWLEPLIAGSVDEIADTRGLVGPIDRRLHGVDVAVNLHGRGPQSHRLLLELEPGRMLGFAHAEIPGTRGFPAWLPGEHEVLRWCRMVSAFGWQADPSRLDLPPPQRDPPADAVGATLIHPGAASLARRWPPERWAGVARFEAETGRRVFLTGTESERAVAEDVARRAGLPVDSILAGRTDLVHLAALVASAGRVVCGDTGVAHLATALGVPSVVLFGPTPPAEWGPPADRPWHVVLWKGRRGDPHAAQPDPGLLQITVAEVVDALETLPSPSHRFGPVERGRSAPSKGVHGGG